MGEIVNQSSSDGVVLPVVPSAVPSTDDGARESGGTLNLTISVLIRHEDLHTALRQHAPGMRWDKKLVEGLRKHEQSTELSLAIEPLFNDIADRKRGLFVEDFLIDTHSRDDLSAEHGPNVCDLIDIDMPKQVRWETEGERLRADFLSPPRFEGVRCRAFWVAHSNLSLSYHLSFEVPYEHTASHYYALSLLQKVFFPTEGTTYLHDEEPKYPSVTSQLVKPAAAVGMADYVEGRFKVDAAHLFQSIFGDPGAGRPRAEGDTLAKTLLYRGMHEEDSCLTDWDRKCVAVLEDPYFFELLNNRKQLSESKLDLVTVDGVERGVLSYRHEILDGGDQDELAYYFLSGFFQNIIDFLRQDNSEVLDGTDP
ncbi:hypothetical protein, partial [Lentzea sp.]|uniref:hypothetical protein n=1 Tax=Lentzea sp. TaxID=56099 RepID=UPI002ED16DC9